MRIAINGWFSDQLATGSGQYLTALLAWLPRVGAEHEFVVVRPGIGESANRQICKSQIANRKSADRDLSGNPRFTFHVSRFTSYVSHLSPPLAKLWFEQIAFPRACRHLGADVAFVPYWGSPFWSPCPVVVTVHDLIPLLLPLYRGGPLQRAYTALVSRTARRAAAVLTDSEASKRDIIAHLGIEPACVHAIHLAADPRYTAITDAAELARVRAKYGLPDEPFLLYLGGFDVRKNVVRMIEAYALMAEQMADGRWPEQRATLSQMADDDRPLLPRSSAPLPLCPKLVIAGKLPATDTPFAPDPRPVVARLGIGEWVHFTGWVDEADKPALYALAVGTVFVSEVEGFGLGVVEGMGGAGLPDRRCSDDSE